MQTAISKHQRSSSSNFYQNYNARVTSHNAAGFGEPLLKLKSLITEQDNVAQYAPSPQPPPLVLKRPRIEIENDC